MYRDNGDFTCILFASKEESSQNKIKLPFFYAIKGSGIPLEIWTSPEGSGRFRIPDFKTIGALRW